MALSFPVTESGKLRNSHRLSLAFFWFAGLISGIFFYNAAEEVCDPLICRIPCSATSFFSLLFSAALPFLFSAFAFFLASTALLTPVIFGEGFLFSLVSFGLIQAYGDAGWLVCGLILLSRWVCEPFLYFMWLRFLSDSRSACGSECFFWTCLAILSECVYFCIISPFLACLIII